MKIFPELAGKLVFFGDDGQADLSVATEVILKHMVKDSFGKEKYAAAFVAIQAVRVRKDAFLYKEEFREERLELIRKRVGKIFDNGKWKERFFYHKNYCDLEFQLKEAGWVHDDGRPGESCYCSEDGCHVRGVRKDDDVVITVGVGEPAGQE